jgi:hypothetical protein
MRYLLLLALLSTAHAADKKLYQLLLIVPPVTEDATYTDPMVYVIAESPEQAATMAVTKYGGSVLEGSLQLLAPREEADVHLEGL